MAFDIRQRFQCDVFIDFNCYRKYGHNEGDEPAFTQPLEYQIIRKKRSIRQLILYRLLGEGAIDQKSADELVDRDKLNPIRSLYVHPSKEQARGAGRRIIGQSERCADAC